MSHAERQMRQGGDHDSGLPLLTLERLTFRFVGAGFVLLTATGRRLAVWRAALRQGMGVESQIHFLPAVLAGFAVLLFGRKRFGWRSQSAHVFLYRRHLCCWPMPARGFVIEVLLERAA
jgi:ABC-type uncharacterized transport system permease subunit